MNSGINAQTKKFDILSFTVPAKFKLIDQNKRMIYQAKDATTFGMVQLWPAQQGSTDPQTNFKSDWNFFAGTKYNIGEPTETQSEKQNGWDIITGVGFAEVDGAKFIVSVSTFTQGDITWCAVTQFNDEKYAADIDKLLMSINADAKKFVRKTNPQGNQTVNNNNNNTVVNNSNPVSNGFHFTTTNFDDGWVAIPQEDWVLATKGNIKAHIHYPNKQADEYDPDGDRALKNAWNILVALRYSNATNMFFKDGDHFFSLPNYGSAEVMDNATGKRVYVVLYKRTYYTGNNKYVEIIAPNQSAFEAMFGNYETNKANKTWDALNNMQEKNKFAVAAGDLKGTWTTDFGAAISYVSVFTGLPAHTDVHSSTESFQCFNGGKYNWELSVANGRIGDIRFASAKSAGTVTVPDNWHVRFSDIEGKPRIYDAMFSCIKGLRILWLDGKAFAKKD